MLTISSVPTFLRQHKQPLSIVSELATDASLNCIGGWLTDRSYFHYRLPSIWKGKNIAYLEMWGIIVAIKVWGSQLSGM